MYFEETDGDYEVTTYLIIIVNPESIIRNRRAQKKLATY